MAIFMKFAAIKGRVTTEGFKDWIELTSFQLNVNRSVTSGASGRQRESSHPEISDVTITKPFDDASPKLYQDALAGAFDSKVEVKFTTTTKNKVDTFLSYELTNCGVSHYTVASSNENPIETLSMNFTKIMVSPSILDEKGSPKAGDKYTYDLSTNKGS